jgi:GTPase
MLPVIAIVGRPNVGKSTLFNCLTGSRDALVADEPGLTRDRKYGIGRLGSRQCVLIDTGGLSDDADEIAKLTVQQAQQAILEADLILFVVDGRSGVAGADLVIAEQLRRASRAAPGNTSTPPIVSNKSTPVVLVVNKSEGLDPDVALAEFHEMGLGDPLPIAAAHQQGLIILGQRAGTLLPEEIDAQDPETIGSEIHVALVGRPNVGKSTLMNRILGQERTLAHHQPGTTRDSIYVPFNRDGQSYTLIDTAGVRRRARVSERIEKFSVVKTLQAIAGAHVVILLMDAQEGVTDQDVSLLGLVLDSGRGLVVAMNKRDGLDESKRLRVREELARKLTFLDFAQEHFISARHGSGVGNLFQSVNTAWESANRQMPTPRLNEILIEALTRHPPPMVRGRRIKLRYAHQGGHNPPMIIIHGNQTHAVPDAYKRYLTRTFMTKLGLKGTPLRIEFKTSDNPFKGRKNILTPRQKRQRQRLIRHVR